MDIVVSSIWLHRNASRHRRGEDTSVHLPAQTAFGSCRGIQTRPFSFLISVIIIFFPFSQRAGYNFTFFSSFFLFFNRAEQEPSPPLYWEFVETVLLLEECKWLREVDGGLGRQLSRCRTLWKPKKGVFVFVFIKRMSLLAWQEVVKE